MKKINKKLIGLCIFLSFFGIYGKAHADTISLQARQNHIKIEGVNLKIPIEVKFTKDGATDGDKVSPATLANAWYEFCLKPDDSSDCAGSNDVIIRPTPVIDKKYYNILNYNKLYSVNIDLGPQEKILRDKAYYLNIYLWNGKDKTKINEYPLEIVLANIKQKDTFDIIGEPEIKKYYSNDVLEGVYLKYSFKYGSTTKVPGTQVTAETQNRHIVLCTGANCLDPYYNETDKHDLTGVEYNKTYVQEILMRVLTLHPSTEYTVAIYEEDKRFTNSEGETPYWNKKFFPSKLEIKNNEINSTPPPSDIGGKIQLRNPLKTEFDSIPTIVTAVIQKIIIPLTIPFVVIMIIWSGFLLVKSQGNPGELEKAKNAIKWTFIGALVILASYVIAEAIQGTIIDMIGYVKNWYV